MMKIRRTAVALLAGLALIATAGFTHAFEKSEAKSDKKAKPYPLKTCLISDEVLDSDPGMKSFAFVHEGQEIKLCCKNCQKDFKKDPTKFLKKMKETVAKEAAKGTK